MPHPPEVMELGVIRLRRPGLPDAEGMFDCGSDPEVARYADWPLATSIGRIIERIQRSGQRWESGGEYRWTIALPETDEAAGAISLLVDGHVAELGFLVRRCHWGKGYATAAARAVVAWAMDQPEIWRVWATCDCGNLASIRVLEKTGFMREGRLRRATVRPNLSAEPRDALLYARVR